MEGTPLVVVMGTLGLVIVALAVALIVMTAGRAEKSEQLERAHTLSYGLRQSRDEWRSRAVKAENPSPLRSYDHGGQCPKCKLFAASMMYCSNRPSTLLSGSEPIPVALCISDPDVEHFHRECPNCGYTWFERVTEKEEGQQ